MADAPLDIRTSKYRTTLFAIALVAMVLIVYAPTIGHPFVQWDDQVLIFENPSYNPPTWDAVAKFWTQPFRHLYQPIAFSIWAAVAWMAYTPGGGLTAAYFHAASIAVHTATVVLVFVLLRRLLTDRRAAAVGAGLFAIHPVFADPVNWASSLYTLLASLFAVAAVVAFDAFTLEPNRRRRWALFTLATLLFAAACLSKASAVVAIGLAAVVAVYRSQPISRRLLFSLMVWALIGISIIIVAKRVQPALKVVDLGVLDRAAVALDATAFYARKAVWPWPMTIDYGRTPEHVIGALSSNVGSRRIGEWLFLLVPVGISVGAIYLRRRWPELLLGWAWFVIALLPVLGLTKFEFQHISTVADRYAALAMVGPGLAAAGAARRRFWVRPVMVAVLVAFGIATVAQSSTWRDTQTLMTHAERINPRSKVACATLAEMLARSGEFEPAEREFLKAIDNDPDAATPRFDYANLLARQARFFDAIKQYRLAIAADPALPQSHVNLGVALAKSGDSAGAVGELRRAITLSPADANAYADLGLVLSRQGDIDAATKAYTRALRLNPSQSQAAHGLQSLRTARQSPEK